MNMPIALAVAANAAMRVGFVAGAYMLATHEHPVMAGWLIFAVVTCGLSWSKE